MQRAPLVAVDILVGTDVQLLAAAPGTRRGVRVPRYVPNLQVEARDAFLGGDLRVHTAERELTYTKRVDVNGVTLGLSAVYNYLTHTPYAGFTVEATPGVSSSAGSNGLSINHRRASCRSARTASAPLSAVTRSFRTSWLEDTLRTRVDVLGSVALPGTRYNSMTRKLGLQVRARALLRGCCGVRRQTAVLTPPAAPRAGAHRRGLALRDAHRDGVRRQPAARARRCNTVLLRSLLRRRAAAPRVAPLSDHRASHVPQAQCN